MLVTVNPTANPDEVRNAIQNLGVSVVAHQASVNMMQVSFKDSDFPDINVLITRLRAIAGVERVDLDYALIANASQEDGICPNDESQNRVPPSTDGWWRNSLHIDLANKFIANNRGDKSASLAIVEIKSDTNHDKWVLAFAKKLRPSDTTNEGLEFKLYSARDIAEDADFLTKFFLTDMIEATKNALKEKKKVFNFSIGKPIISLDCSKRKTIGPDPWSTQVSQDMNAMYSPIDKLLKQYDALGVVAAANYGVRNVSKPFTSDNIIFVGSHTEYSPNKQGSEPRVSTHSNDGDFVDIYAPGTALNMPGADFSFLPDSGGAILSAPLYGTSLSAPFVAATAAWIKALKPSLTASELKALVLQTSSGNVPDDEVITILNGKPVLNAYAVIKKAVTVPLLITTQPANQSVIAGQRATFSVEATGPGWLAYQWKKDGNNIASATGTSYTTPPTTLSDDGAVYSVAISGNAVTSATSNNATLTVTAPEVGLPVVNPETFNIIHAASGSQDISVSGSGFTANSWHQFSSNAGSTWSNAGSAPVFKSATSLTVAINKALATGTTLRIRVCKSVSDNANASCSSGYVTVNIGSVNIITTTSKLPHTGITPNQCYQADSNALVSCASDGAIALSGAGKQDGMYTNLNPMSYSLVDSYTKEECVKDNVTGLIWEGKPASGTRAESVTYTNYGDGRAGDASAYVVAVNAQALCGYTDWRQPTVDELETLVDAGRTNPAINTTWFPNTSGTWYWTASPDVGSSNNAWNVSFSDGYVYYGLRYNDGHVRLVRASQ